MADAKVALVTGAARGIGAATVQALATDGWAVVAVDRCTDDPRLAYHLGTEAELHTVVEQAGGPARVIPVVANASDASAMARAAQLAEERFGGLDAAIAAAGVIAGGMPLWEMPTDQQEAVFEANLQTLLATARASIPALLRRPKPRAGRFLAVTSTGATRGLPMLAAYCAAKAAASGLIRALATELRGTGVTANAVSPGATRTAMLDESARIYDLRSAESFAAQQPLDRLLEPAEIAGFIVWLASPAASGITGAVLPVDGGLAL